MWFSIMEPAGSTPRGGGPPLPLSAEAAPWKDPEASRANSILCRGRTDFPELGCRGKGSDGQRVPPGSHTVGAGFLSLLPHGTHDAVVQTPTSHPEPSQDWAMESSPGNVLRAAGLWAVASAGGPGVPRVRATLVSLRACGVWPRLSLAGGRAAHRLTKLLVSQGSSSHGMGGHVPPGHGRRYLSDVAPARCWPAFPCSPQPDPERTVSFLTSSSLFGTPQCGSGPHASEILLGGVAVRTREHQSTDTVESSVLNALELFVALDDSF